MDTGTCLREAREARGLSIATLAASTRIKAKALDAIERNDLAGLPPGPYARGFVAAYAREIGLNPQEIVRTYFAQFEPVLAEPAKTQPDAPPAAGNRRHWAPALGIAVTAAVLVTVGLLASRSGDPAPRPEPAAIGTSGVVPVATGAAAERRPSAARDATRRSPAPGRGVVVTLEATGPAWIAATADGKRSLYQILPAGSTHTLRADREIALRVGDAGMVRLSVNGGAPQVMGAPGEVVNATLTPEGASR